MTSEQPSTILRFSGASRAVHWLVSALFLLLLATGLLLYVPIVKGQHLGGFRIVPLLHVILGIASIAAVLPAYLLPDDRRLMRGDLRQLCHFERGDSSWFRYAFYALLGARLRPPSTHKFNAGQKANTVAVAIFTAGLMLTGAVLAVNYFTKRVFAASLVEQIYTLHDAFMLVSVPIVGGHIFLATLNPSTRPSLRGMLGGSVNREWARLHHDRWVEEVEAQTAPPGPSPTS